MAQLKEETLFSVMNYYGDKRKMNEVQINKIKKRVDVVGQLKRLLQLNYKKC